MDVFRSARVRISDYSRRGNEIRQQRKGFTVSSRGACRTPWSRRRSSSASCARPFYALHPRELASSVVPLLGRLSLTPLRLLGDEWSPRRHLADHSAARTRPSLRDDDVAGLAFDSPRDRHSAINPPPLPARHRAHVVHTRVDAHDNYFVRSADFSRPRRAGEYNLQSTSSSLLLSSLISRSLEIQAARWFSILLFSRLASNPRFASRLLDNHYRDKNLLLFVREAREHFFD